MHQAFEQLKMRAKRWAIYHQLLYVAFQTAVQPVKFYYDRLQRRRTFTRR